MYYIIKKLKETEKVLIKESQFISYELHAALIVSIFTACFTVFVSYFFYLQRTMMVQ